MNLAVMSCIVLGLVEVLTLARICVDVKQVGLAIVGCARLLWARLYMFECENGKSHGRSESTFT